MWKGEGQEREGVERRGADKKGKEESLTLSSRHPLHANPPEQEHAGVVIDMEEGHLVVLLAKYEEELVRGPNDE